MLSARAVLRIVAFVAAIGLVLFLPAGTLGWWRAWVMLGVYIAFIIGWVLLLRRYNPELLEARQRGAGEGTKGFDKLFVPAWTVLLLALMVVSGLDASRFQWASLPAWTLAPGLALQVLGMVPVSWAGVHNPHLEGTVRIQEDRGHRVVSSGPYAWVRHPMYTGSLLWVAALPLVLGSAWAYVPAVLAMALMVWRTGREDATLIQELDGYAEYAQQDTRYRLIPWIW